MSDKVKGLAWSYYKAGRFGAPKILVIALADEADDLGGGIFQSVTNLADKTDQGERSVRYQLRRLEDSGLVVLVEKSGGGSGKFNHYRLDLAVLIGVSNPAPDAGLMGHGVPGSEAPNPAPNAGFSAPLYKSSKDLNLVGGAAHDRVDDERLARWMFDRLRILNPKHREPAWRTWFRDIRLMIDRDKRTHREIAELFAWANADPFWQVNILSPGKLREKWDQLQIKRRANGGGGHHAEPEDRNCVGGAGVLCGNPGAFKSPDGRWRCHSHRDSSAGPS